MAKATTLVSIKVQTGINIIAIGSKPTDEPAPKKGKGKAKGTEQGNGYKKTECPISADDFMEHARTIRVRINGDTIDAEPRVFSSGSFGWYANGKVKVDVQATEVLKGAKGSDPKKTVCPVTVDDFVDNARPLSIHIGNDSVEADVKIFSSGSFGWYATGKVKVNVNGHDIKCQVGGNLIAIGSKPTDK